DAFLSGWGIGQIDQTPAIYKFVNVRDNLQGLIKGTIPVEDFLRCAKDADFAKANLGMEALPSSLSNLDTPFTTMLDRKASLQAVNELKPLIVTQLHSLNREIQANYAAYMQLHEKEALVVGEMARLRSVELGPMTR